MPSRAGFESEYPFPSKFFDLDGVRLHYVDEGRGETLLCVHGNPTWSYLWRNIIPHLLPFGRCLAPDYVGMGNSGPAPDGNYRFFDHRRYLDAWFEAMGLTSRQYDPDSFLEGDWDRAQKPVLAER